MSGAVVCDLDGTLVDSAPGLRFAVNQLLAEEGRRPLALADVIPMIGDGAARLVHSAFAATGAPAEAEQLNELVTWFHDHYEEVALRLTTPYPRVPETLQRLRDDGFSLSVCTNKLHRLAKLILVGLDLARYFDMGRVPPIRPPPQTPSALFGIYRWGWGFSTSQDFNGDIALIACFASSWTAAMVGTVARHPFGFLRPWNELPALFGSAPPAMPPSTGSGVVVCLRGVVLNGLFDLDRGCAGGEGGGCRRAPDDGIREWLGEAELTCVLAFRGTGSTSDGQPVYYQLLWAPPTEEELLVRFLVE